MIARIQYTLGGIAIGALLASYGYLGFAHAASDMATSWDIGVKAQTPPQGQVGAQTMQVPLKAAPPDSASVPFTVKCYQHNFTPFVVNDEHGNIIFEIRCP